MEQKIEAYGESALADIKLGGEMVDALAHYYPGHAFFVECNQESGQLTIQLLYQDKKKLTKKWNHGMLVHTRNLQSHDQIMKYAMRFGGELLERYNLAREGVNPYTWMDASANGMNLDGAIR